MYTKINCTHLNNNSITSTPEHSDFQSTAVGKRKRKNSDSNENNEPKKKKKKLKKIKIIQPTKKSDFESDCSGDEIHILTQEEVKEDNTRTVQHKNDILDVDILFTSDYHDLALNLSTKLSDKKLKEIGIIKNFILIVEEQNIINCFEFNSKDANHGQEVYGQNHCICKHEIKYVYYIENKDTKEKVIVGSKCVQRFYSSQWEEYDKMRKEIQKKKKQTAFKCINCHKNIVQSYFSLCTKCS
eukprot:16202_1